MTGRPSRPPSATALVLASFMLTAGVIAGPHWLRHHAGGRPAALAASPAR